MNSIKLRATLAIMVAILPCLPINAAEPVFQDLTFEEALKLAGEQNKPLMVDFTTSWCGYSHQMDAQTFGNPKVQAFLKDRVIAVQIDAEKDVKNAYRYGVDSYPTFVFIKPDGSTMDTLESFMDPDEFIQNAQWVLEGIDFVERTRLQMVASGGENDPSERYRYGQALFYAERYEEAMVQYLWCFEEGLSWSPAFYGVRLSYLMSSFSELIDVYPEAKTKLVELRDARLAMATGEDTDLGFVELKNPEAFKDYGIENAPTTQSFTSKFDLAIADFIELSKVLDEEEKIWELFEDQKKNHPDSKLIEKLTSNLYEELLIKRDYETIAKHIDLGERFDTSMMAYQEQLKMSSQYPELREFASDSLIGDTAGYVQILMAQGEHDQACTMIGKVLQKEYSAMAINELAWAGYLSGNSDEHILDMAKKAVEMDGWKDANSGDTYIRLLVQHGKKEEAQTAFEKLCRIAGFRGMSVTSKLNLDLKNGVAGDPVASDIF